LRGAAGTQESTANLKLKAAGKDDPTRYHRNNDSPHACKSQAILNMRQLQRLLQQCTRAQALLQAESYFPFSFLSSLHHNLYNNSNSEQLVKIISRGERSGRGG
jgi:hypothetical protein